VSANHRITKKDAVDRQLMVAIRRTRASFLPLSAITANARLVNF
jgi:hypothetical protein